MNNHDSSTQPNGAKIASKRQSGIFYGPRCTHISLSYWTSGKHKPASSPRRYKTLYTRSWFYYYYRLPFLPRLESALLFFSIDRFVQRVFSSRHPLSMCWTSSINASLQSSTFAGSLQSFSWKKLSLPVCRPAFLGVKNSCASSCRCSLKNLDS